MTQRKFAKNKTRNNLVSNHAIVNVDSDTKLFNYYVDFSPELEDKRLRTQSVREAVRELMGGRRYVYDGNARFTSRIHFQEVSKTKFLSLQIL